MAENRTYSEPNSLSPFQDLAVPAYTAPPTLGSFTTNAPEHPQVGITLHEEDIYSVYTSGNWRQAIVTGLAIGQRWSSSSGNRNNYVVEAGGLFDVMNLLQEKYDHIKGELLFDTAQAKGLHEKLSELFGHATRELWLQNQIKTSPSDPYLSENTLDKLIDIYMTAVHNHSIWKHRSIFAIYRETILAGLIRKEFLPSTFSSKLFSQIMGTEHLKTAVFAHTNYPIKPFMWSTKN